MAVMVTISPGAGSAGKWSTWRICGGMAVTACFTEFSAPGVGTGLELASFDSSRSMEKSELFWLVLKPCTAITLVPPTR